MLPHQSHSFSSNDKYSLKRTQQASETQRTRRFTETPRERNEATGVNPHFKVKTEPGTVDEETELPHKLKEPKLEPPNPDSPSKQGPFLAPVPPRISEKVSWEFPTPLVREPKPKVSHQYPRAPPAPLLAPSSNDIDIRSKIVLDNDDSLGSNETIPLLLNTKPRPTPEAPKPSQEKTRRGDWLSASRELELEEFEESRSNSQRSLQESLPSGWEVSFHQSGLPIYFHVASNVATFAKPFKVKPNRLEKVNPPISAVPCLAQKSRSHRDADEPLKANELSNYIRSRFNVR